MRVGGNIDMDTSTWIYQHGYCFLLFTTAGSPHPPPLHSYVGQLQMASAASVSVEAGGQQINTTELRAKLEVIQKVQGGLCGCCVWLEIC